MTTWARHKGMWIPEDAPLSRDGFPVIAEDLEELKHVMQTRWRDLGRTARSEGPWAAAGAGGFVVIADGVTAAAAGTAKSVLKVLAASNRAVKLAEVSVGFIGASGSAKPVLVEITTNTEAGAGTGSSAVTPAQSDASDGNTVQASAAKGYTGEPTTQTPVRRYRVHPQAGQVIQLPLGRELRSGIAKSLITRVTFETGETTTNVDAVFEFEE